MFPLVSIVIPVYNLEKYIENCLNRITSQTYSNLEIICIDDGSKDGSAEIIKDLVKSDNRIKYFYQENAGVSTARNNALEKASGEYVTFVDGDDFLHPQAIELFVKCAIEKNADIVCADFETINSLNVNFEKIDNPLFENCDFNELFISKRSLQIGETCWGKLFKKSFINNFKFPTNLSYSEDTFFFISVIKNNPKIYFIDCKIYYYLQRQGSATSSNYRLAKMSAVHSYASLCDLLKTSSCSIVKSFCFKGLYRYIFYNRMFAKKSPFESQVKKDCRKIGFKWLFPYLVDKKSPIITKLLYICFFICPPLYEFARTKSDPTLKEHLKEIRK